MLVFSALTLLLTYGIERLQHILPLNPQNFGPVPADLAFNTAASFTTNTNWQAYSGESTMSYLTQMTGLAWHNFISAAVGIGIALALARGITYRLHPTAPKAIGNFWVDLIRSIVYVLLPISIPVALVLVSQGVIQNFSSYVEVTTLEGAKQTLAMGPVASQEIIKELGTNGSGFFNANSAHPFESPNPLTNLIEMLLIFSIPAAITYTYGRMARDQKQGWVLFAAMALIFVVGVWVAYFSEAQGNPLMRGMALDQGAGNWEGKEVRFGIVNSALWAVITTATSCGAVNAMHDSFTALGGLVSLANIQLGELVFGGVGAGLYAMLIYVILSVFIAGLMVGRTPEYLGKKIESREIKLSMLYVLIFPLLIIYYAGWSLVAPYGVSSLNNAGPHGLSEILYAYSSAAGNNGSAFAGLNANTPVVQRDPRPDDARGALLDDRARYGGRWFISGQEGCAGKFGHFTDQRIDFRRAPGRCHYHRWRPDVFPGARAWSHRGTFLSQCRKGLLKWQILAYKNVHCSIRKLCGRQFGRVSVNWCRST